MSPGANRYTYTSDRKRIVVFAFDVFDADVLALRSAVRTAKTSRVRITRIAIDPVAIGPVQEIRGRDPRCN